MNIVDGKLDVVGHVTDPREDFLFSIANIAADAQAASIAKMETHLLFGSQVDQTNTAEGATLGQYVLTVPGLQLHECACKTSFDKLAVPSCPGGVQQAVDNLLFLFRSILKDPTNCCDVRPAVIACIEGLTRLTKRYFVALQRLEQWNAMKAQSPAITPGDDASLSAIVDSITERREKIERWVILCERVLRQRTIGSFEEFLGQSDRALFYRGGAQKMLLLADSLMNEFYARVAPRLARRISGGDIIFASLYDAVDRIESEIGTGLVRVPAGDVFLLAATLPDLWHEVGTHLFFHSFDDRDAGVDFNAGPEDAEAYGEIADCFGDLIVLVYGFRCDVRRFVVSVLQSWARTQANDDDAVKALALPDLLERLILAIEVVTFLQRPLNLNADHLMATVWSIIGDHFAEERIRIPQKVWRTLKGMLHDERHDVMFNLLRQMVPHEDTIVNTAQDRSTHNSGNALIRFDDHEEINDAFADLYWKINGSRQKHKHFGETASLGRSAVIEYHRRHAQRDAS